MMGAGAVQCPHCGTLMDERARFCPGCGTPRTAVREQLERESAATGVPYTQLLERQRNTGDAQPPEASSSGWATSAPIAPAPSKGHGRLWLVLGIIGGILLLLCVGCGAASLILLNRFDVDLGDSPEGDAARNQLELATAGRFDERWQRLHPEQQPFVPLDLFATCAEYAGAGSIDILASIGDNDSTLPRVGLTDARVVVYTISVDGSTQTDYVEMVLIDDQWRWTLESNDIRAYESGRCP